MDLSHMIGLWLAGQSAGAGPGGVGVVYAPAGVGESGDKDAIGGYPFSAERWLLEEGAALTMRAGLGLIGELEYGPKGLDGFVPRLFGAVNLPYVETEQAGHAEGLAAASHAGEGEAPGGDPHFRGAQVWLGDVEMFGSSVNRGEASIGLSDKLQFVDRFDDPEKGVLSRARVVGFVEREGEITPVSEDVAVADFPVLFEKLSDYLCFQVAAQVAANGYDDLAGALAKSERPAHAVVIAGVAPVAASLRDAGPVLRPNAAIAPGEVCHSVVYDSAVTSLEQVEAALRAGETDGVLSAEGVSWLGQVVEMIDD